MIFVRLRQSDQIFPHCGKLQMIVKKNFYIIEIERNI
jgi:hypothetical protein